MVQDKIYSIVNENEDELYFINESPVLKSANQECVVKTPISINDIQTLLEYIPQSHSEDYNDWVNICRILVNISKSDNQNIEKYISMFHEFSSRSNKYDPDSCTLKWENIFNSYEIGLAGPGIGSLIFIAKENGFQGEVGRLFIPTNDYDIANAVKQFTKHQYITHKFGCFKFKKHIGKNYKVLKTILEVLLQIGQTIL